MPICYQTIEDFENNGENRQIPFIPAAQFIVFWDDPRQGAGYYQVWVTVLVQERITINLSERVETELILNIIDFRGTNRHTQREYHTTYYPEDIRPLPEEAVAA